MLPSLGSRLARQRNPLTQLVAPPQSLAPVRAKTNLVATPPPPPSLFRYGPQERGAAQSSRYTGGVVGNPYRPIENINSDFVSPSYPAMSPLVGAVGGGGAGIASALPALAALVGGISPTNPTKPPAPPAGVAPRKASGSRTGLGPAPTQPVQPNYPNPIGSTGTSGELPPRLNPRYFDDVTRLTRAALFGGRIGGTGGYWQV